MLRETFENIIEMTRAEARLSTNTSRGIDHQDHVKQVIRRVYTQLAEEFDWEHLRLRRGAAVKTMAAGQRYYDFPVNLNIQKIEGATFKWGNQWHRLNYGISDADYNDQDSDTDQRSDPVYRWAYYAADAGLQFEVHPMPASNTGVVHFLGQKQIEALTELANRADLDDILISLRAAAALLAEGKQEEAANEKLGAAEARRQVVRGALSNKARWCIGTADPTQRGGGYRPREITHISLS